MWAPRQDTELLSQVSFQVFIVRILSFPTWERTFSRAKLKRNGLRVGRRVRRGPTCEQLRARVSSPARAHCQPFRRDRGLAETYRRMRLGGRRPRRCHWVEEGSGEVEFGSECSNWSSRSGFGEAWLLAWACVGVIPAALQCFLSCGHP